MEPAREEIAIRAHCFDQELCGMLLPHTPFSLRCPRDVKAKILQLPPGGESPGTVGAGFAATARVAPHLSR